MNSEFSFTSKFDNGILVIKTEGYINSLGGEAIAKEFEKYFDNGLKNVLIDLEKSKIINSIAITFFIEIIKKLIDKKGKLYFTNLDSTIEKTFSIMGLFQFAEKVNSVDEIK
ncbi:MAG: STAS domain-containing protein [Melioribacteraceae bacterium]